MMILKLLQKLNPFKTTTDQDRFSSAMVPFKDKLKLPINVNFDGTVSWFNTIDLVQDPNFFIKTKNEYLQFKKLYQNSNQESILSNYREESILELIGITPEHTSLEIKDVLEKLTNIYSKRRFFIDLEKVDNINDLATEKLSIINLVILDFTDFYQKIGMNEVSESFIPLIRKGRPCGINFTVVGDLSDIPAQVKVSLTNIVEGTHSQLYVNNDIFDNVSKKYFQALSLLKNKAILSFHRVEVIDDVQLQNNKSVSLGNLYFYQNSEYEDSLHLDNERKKRVLNNYNKKFNYIFIMSVNHDGDYVVGNPVTKKVGILIKEKFNQVSKARIYHHSKKGV